MAKSRATDATINLLIKLRKEEILKSVEAIKRLAAEAVSPPTPKQLEETLEQLRKAWRDLPDNIESQRLTQQQASAEISRIKQSRESDRLRERQLKSQERLEALRKAPELPDGVYRDPKSSKIYKVKKAVHGSGLKVAHQLIIEEEVSVIDNSNRYEHDVIKIKKPVGRFKYVGLASKHVTLNWKLSLEEAKKWGVLYGVCCNCGRTLTKEESIQAGIGPICAGKDIW